MILHSFDTMTVAPFITPVTVAIVINSATDVAIAATANIDTVIALTRHIIATVATTTAAAISTGLNTIAAAIFAVYLHAGDWFALLQIKTDLRLREL